MASARLRRQALLIGPSYDLLPAHLQLDGTTADLSIIKRIITQSSFKFDHIKELMGQNATKNNILSCLAEITRNAEHGSIVMVYYSGHGWRWTGGWAHERNWDEGLLPADITPQQIKSGSIANACVTGEDMRGYLVQLSQKKVSVSLVFDCCFSGHMYRGPEFNETDFKRTKAREVTLASLLKIEERDESTRSPIDNNEPVSQDGENRPRREWKNISEGWLPQDDDSFFHLAACSSIEKAWEGVDSKKNKICGLFTSTLSSILETWGDSREPLSYNALSSLIHRHFKMRNISCQTPQLEGTNLDTVLFGKDIVRQSSQLIEVGDVITQNSLTFVQLLGGHLQLLQDGVYDIYEPTVEDSYIILRSYSKNEFWVGTIDVAEHDVDMTTAIGHVIEKGENKEIMPGCKAHLRQRHGARTSVAIISSSPEEFMKEKLANTQMFRVLSVKSSNDYSGTENEVMLQKELVDGGITLKADKFNSVFVEAAREAQALYRPAASGNRHLYCTHIEKENCISNEHWCARMNGKMIVPPVYTNQEEDLMAANLTKFFRYNLALKQPPSNKNLLLNVELKVSKLQKVKHFGYNAILRNERFEEARTKQDLYTEYTDDPNSARPRFMAHKMKKICVNGVFKDTLEDETGDAVVIRVTNNEEFPIHIVLLIYQLDGSIAVMYPPRDGATIPLSPGESVNDIHRINIPENALRKFTQPDSNMEPATEGIDTIMLYASSKPCDMGPLLQPALDLGGKLKGKGDSNTMNVTPLTKYLTALKERCLEEVSEPDSKWLIEKREFVVVANI